MGRMIIKLTEGDQSWYLEWSTIVDAPVLICNSLEQFKKFYQEEYGRSSMDDLERRLKRVEETGTSSFMYDSVDAVIRSNRAGQKETCLSKEQIIKYYCTKELTERPIGEKIKHDD
jgi:hypothetical protein